MGSENLGGDALNILFNVSVDDDWTDGPSLGYIINLV
jgi:hypothetical protein